MFKSNQNSDSTPENKNWYKDRYETVLTHRNFLAVIALSSLVLAMIAGLGILSLVPSKTVIPFLIQVDDKTGATQILDPTSQDEISADESLRKYFAVKFIKARESYDSNDIDLNANIVRLLAAPTIYSQYWRSVADTRNRESLYVTLGAGKMRQVNIKAVQFLDENRAHIRLSIVEQNKDGGQRSEKHYVALVTFEFANLELKINDMLVNPLGFRVTAYKIDEDTAL